MFKASIIFPILSRYVLSPENWLECGTIVFVSVVLFHDQGDNAEVVKRHLAAVSIVLSWAELITLVGKHPKLTRYNVYVTMFYKVQYSLSSKIYKPAQT